MSVDDDEAATERSAGDPPAPNRARRRAALIGTLLLLVLVVVVVGVLLFGDDDESAPSARKPEILLDVAGVGSSTTKPFSAQKGWVLTWSYDCSEQASQQGLFIVTTEGSSGIRLVSRSAGKERGVEKYPAGGTFRLDVQSDCMWSLSVRGRRLSAG